MVDFIRETKYTNMLKMMINTNWMILLLLVWNETCFQHSFAQTTSTDSKFAGETVTLSCSLIGTFTFPEWRGPPSLTPYTNLGDLSGAISPAAPAASRLRYADNNQDLLLSNANTNDTGDYQCTYTGLGDHTISLTVNPAPTPEPVPPGPDCCCCLKDCTELDKGVCILVCIIIYFFASLVVGIIAGMVVEAICHIWEGMNQKWRIASFFALLFGLGLFLCDLIRQRCEANPSGGHAQPDHAQPLQDRPVNFN